MSSTKEKSEKFTDDAKIQILSLKDALEATRQISKISSDRENIGKYNEIYKRTVRKREILLMKDNENLPLSRINLLSYKSIEALFVYSLYSYSFNLYGKNINRIDKCISFDCLDNEFKKIENELFNELKKKTDEMEKKHIKQRE